MLPKESAAEPGPWRTARAPYQRGMMDAILDPGVEEVVFYTASQIGKTEILNNIVGYFIDQDPSPILVVMPTVELAEAWSKDRLSPTIHDTPVLRAKVREPRSRDSGNTITHKRFPGGHISIVGANAPAALSSRPIRIVLCDEVDRFPASAGVEGDPVALAARRAATFWNRKRVLTSTPTLKDLSRIEQAWKESDQREFYVPCPACGAFQVLHWTPGDGHGGIVYEKDSDDRAIPETARYRCGKCMAEIEETQKAWMLDRGEWRATHPDRPVRGFHISALYSPWVRWAEMAAEWDSAHRNPERLKVFINTMLGESWEERGETVDAHVLLGRAESYGAEVPKGVGLLTASVDVQGDRLEVKVKGWGAGEESWLIAVEQLPGDPGQPQVWQDLTLFLRQPFRHLSGRKVQISATAIDTGGLHTEAVYKYCRAMSGDRVFAIKGGSVRGLPLISRPTVHNRYRIRLYTLGVDAGKDAVYSRLRIASVGPGFMHFPDTIDEEYCEQLCSERAVRRWDKKKGVVREYVKTRERNEAIDLEVYALAALHILGPVVMRSLAERAAALARPVGSGPEPASEEEQFEARLRALNARRRRWIGDWPSY